MALTTLQLNRAVGSVLAAACGDALGSQYEFQPQLSPLELPEFGIGTFGHELGEWTDDTAMALPVLLRLHEGGTFEDSESYDFVLTHWIDWSRTAKDVGVQTSRVLQSLGDTATEHRARLLSRELHERTGRSAGNGSLMRTGPLTLGYLNDGQEENLVAAAIRLAQLTHWEDDNGAACALWCLSIRHAILTGELDVLGQLSFIPEELRPRWTALVDQALAPDTDPTTFTESNGWVVAAFQASLAAINSTDSLVGALHSAIQGGNDTDTVAAITGALAGALYGYSELPAGWLDIVHGWPAATAHNLLGLTTDTVGSLYGSTESMSL